MLTNNEVKHSDLVEDILLNNISIKKNWLHIKKRFNNLYPTFFVSYLKRGVQLTSAEERYLILEKMGMNTENIALLLNVQIESVYTTRYRLRKKLNEDSR